MLDIEEAKLPPPRPESTASIWKTHLDAIPIALSELEGVRHSWNGKTLTVDVPHAERVEYFPSPDEQLVITGQAAIPSDKGVSLRVSYRDVEGAKPPAKSTGVVRVVSDRARYYRIDIPWPKES